MSTIPHGWEVVIGLETHTQLSTASKIFSGSSTAFGKAPNTQASVIDLALPGTLPVLNKAAVECAIKFGLAVSAKIAPRSIFARKNYFYPDLPKGYQISQYELPVVVGGEVKITVGGIEKTIQLTRAHLEEDAGKSLHEGLETSGVSGIDLNRAGTPLLEIVTEPCMASAEEAVAYAKALHGIVTWIGICDGNMQEGSFRCDANVSVRRSGETKLGTRAEIKNVNSFRFLERAIQYEIRRQIEVIEDGGKVVQETRLYDADRDETRSMRSKEDAMDYRYFPDPDLLPLEISREWVDAIRANMPESQLVAARRLSDELGVKTFDAKVLVGDRLLYDYSVAVFYNSPDAMLIKHDAAAAAGFLVANVVRKRNQAEPNLHSVPLHPDVVARLIVRKLDQSISANTAKALFEEAWDLGAQQGAPWTEATVDKIITERGLKQVTDSTTIEKMIDDVIAAHPKSVEEYKAGKDKAFNALFGQVMKASNKTANPAQVTEILQRKLRP